uniref:Glycosyltransferase family 8 protein n=1 Tax=Anisakis simplex TaxID=6269 RepID=A0A0M3K375_ANISI
LILIVVKDVSNVIEYDAAQQTMRCYSTYHKYRLEVLNLSANRTLKGICPHRDFMFARHCVVAQRLLEGAAEWILFIDADMAVINPNRLIEEWIDDDVNIILYDRIFNHEIAAGSYLVKNTNYSIDFLHSWAAYDSNLHIPLYGSDNAALQIVLMENLTPNENRERQKCFRIWEESKDDHDLYVFEACIRSKIGDQHKWMNRVSILRKGTSWAVAHDPTLLGVDIKLAQTERATSCHFSKLDRVAFGSWPSPLTSHQFNLSICSTENAGLNWQYKDTFVRTNNFINSLFRRIIHDAHLRYLRNLAEVDAYL